MRSVKIVTILIFIASSVFYVFGKQAAIKSDNIPPVITAENDHIHVEAGSEEKELLQGLTAMDDVDGDLSAEIMVGSISAFQEKGVSTVEYLVFDKNNNVGRYERTVQFDSYTSPQFKLTKPLMYKLNDSVLISDRLFAEDCLDGNISERIRYASSTLDRTECGTYLLTVNVKNQYGDEVQEILPVNIVPYETELERIQLSTYLIYAEKGTTVFPKAYIEKVTDFDGNEVEQDDVRIISEVDMQETGSGQIRYELYEDGSVVYVTYLTVIVTEQEG